LNLETSTFIECSPSRPDSSGRAVQGLLTTAHALLVGLPIALLAARSARAGTKD
jgi:hypothetical protein